MRVVLDNLGGSSWIFFGLMASAKATVLLLIAMVVDLAVRRHSAAARHLLWTAALLGALALPYRLPIRPLLAAGRLGDADSFDSEGYRSDPVSERRFSLGM